MYFTVPESTDRCVCNANPLLLNANTAVMAKLTNFLPLLLRLPIPITRRPHFIPHTTHFLSSLLLLIFFKQPNDHARTYRRPVHCKLLLPPNRHSRTPQLFLSPQHHRPSLTHCCPRRLNRPRHQPPVPLTQHRCLGDKNATAGIAKTKHPNLAQITFPLEPRKSVSSGLP